MFTIRTLLVLLVLWVGSSSGECPSECVCVPGTDPLSGSEEWVVNCPEVSGLPSSWPDDIQPITEMYFTGIEVSVIPEGYFSSLTSLRRISIRFSKIGEIEPRVFNGVTGRYSDAVIMLSYNEIGTIESEAFSGISNLASVQIVGGSIGTIQSNAFTNVQTGSIIMSKVDIGEIQANAFGSSLQFTTSFNLPSSLGAIPQDLIETLPDLNSTGFAGCENLEIRDSATSFVSLVSNTIETIHHNAFSGIARPTLLNLYGNTMGLIKTGIFGDSGNAISVSFTKNVVEGLADRAFQGLGSTMTFVLTNNEVSCAGEDALSGIQAQETIQQNNVLELVTEADNRTNCQAVLQQPTTEAPTTTSSSTASSTSTTSTSTTSKPPSTTPSRGSQRLASTLVSMATPIFTCYLLFWGKSVLSLKDTC